VAGARHVRALAYQVNGLASGNGSLAHAVLEAASLGNHAVNLRLGPGGALPLELLAADPPDLLVLTGPADEYRTVVAENLRHPAFLAVSSGRETLVLPWRYWLCGTPEIATAIDALAAARRRIELRKSVK
jgi:iron complex transport system substrate-binding protein